MNPLFRIFWMGSWCSPWQLRISLTGWRRLWRTAPSPYEYGVTRTPDIDEELGTRSLSVTNVAVVNGYSEQKETANAFARFLTQEASAELYESAHKLPAFTEAVPETEQAAAFAGEYAQLVPIPKMMTTSNYWVQMEIAFTQIWGGEEVSETLRGLSEQILSQVKGEAVTEEYI